jgi:hypothetical protein
MPNPLDPIWSAHGITLDAYGVVRRALQLPPAERAAAIHGSQFAAVANDQAILDGLDTPQDELDDQTVMFLYATFEATLRDPRPPADRRLRSHCAGRWHPRAHRESNIPTALTTSLSSATEPGSFIAWGNVLTRSSVSSTGSNSSPTRSALTTRTKRSSALTSSTCS